MADDQNSQGTIAGEYEKLVTKRNPYHERAKDCAKLTIPTLVPEYDAKGTQQFTTPYQGVGARGVNNISAKLLLALFPPNQPFFKLTVDDTVLEEMGNSKGEAEEALSIIETRVVKEIHSSPNMRVKALEGIKQLIVAGNVLLYLPPETNTLRVFKLDRYVVERDAMGTVLKTITKEDIAFKALPKATQEKVKDTVNDGDDEKDVALYTKVELDEGKWKVTQECAGVDITDDKPTTYPLDKSPWLALRLIAIDNEDYGRSYVEEYLGDLLSLEGLSKAIVEGSMASAKALFFVNPNGTTRKRTVEQADNLAILEGNAADISVMRLEKASDFRVALETSNGIIERLSFAFLLNSAVQRSGERVTAEEIRYVASELEDSLGGIYSSMAQDLQLPLVTIQMDRLTKQRKIPALPKGIVKPTIITGMEALGRTADLQKLDMFLQSLQVLGEETVSKYLNVGEFIKRRATALQIETKDLIRTEEQVQEAEKQAQQQAMQQQALQGAVPNLTKGAMDMMSQQAQQPQEGTE